MEILNERFENNELLRPLLSEKSGIEKIKIGLNIEELTLFEIKNVINHLIAVKFEYLEIIKICRALQHFKDSHLDLWATDKEPENKKLFFQIK